jgi:hypothetical protein
MFSRRRVSVTAGRLLLMAVVVSMFLASAFAQGQGGLGTVPGIRPLTSTIKINSGQGGGGSHGP